MNNPSNFSLLNPHSITGESAAKIKPKKVKDWAEKPAESNTKESEPAIWAASRWTKG